MSLLFVMNNIMLDHFSLDKIEPNMLTKSFLSLHNSTNIKKDCIIKPLPLNDEIIAEEYIYNDSLFWCLYIIHHGYAEYKQIGHNYGVKELEEKQKVSEFIKKNTASVKRTNYKLTNIAIQEVLSEFMTIQIKKQVSYPCFIALCVYYNINIILIEENGKSLLEFINDTNNKTFVIYKMKTGKYKINVDPLDPDAISEFKTKYIVLYSYLKPLKPIATYTVEDLTIMLTKLGNREEQKKYKKQDLYQAIIQSL
jgi:hypothetical protein